MQGASALPRALIHTGRHDLRKACNIVSFHFLPCGCAWFANWRRLLCLNVLSECVIITVFVHKLTFVSLILTRILTASVCEKGSYAACICYILQISTRPSSLIRCVGKRIHKKYLSSKSASVCKWKAWFGQTGFAKTDARSILCRQVQRQGQRC